MTTLGQQPTHLRGGAGPLPLGSSRAGTIAVLGHHSDTDPGTLVLCLARRWKLRRRLRSREGTTQSPYDRYALALTAPRCWRCCRCTLYEGVCRGRLMVGSRARARASERLTEPDSSRPCHRLDMCTRTGVVGTFSEIKRANVGSQVGIVRDLPATRP